MPHTAGSLHPRIQPTTIENNIFDLQLEVCRCKTYGYGGVTVYLQGKKFLYKWTCIVQTLAIQESNVFKGKSNLLYYAICSSKSSQKTKIKRNTLQGAICGKATSQTN